MNIFTAIFTFFSDILKTEVIKGITLGTIITATVTAATFIVGVKAYRTMKDMQSRGQDILANKTSAGGKIPVIYGSRRVGCQIVYMNTASNSSKDLFVIYALSVGEVENIDGSSIQLDGNLISDASRFKDGGYIGSDKISSGAGSLNTGDNTADITTVSAGTFGTDPTDSYRMVFNLHHGSATQTADPMFTASIGSEWTSAHKLNGIAYIAAKYHYDTRGMWSGIPQLTVVVQGKKVFDPRDNTQTFGTLSTYKWSDNPALCFLDYITNDEYGKGLSNNDINMTTFATAANIAEGTENNADFNGSEQAIAWSGVSGDNFVNISNFADWRKFKVGELLLLKDDNGTTIVNNRTITSVFEFKAFGLASAYLVYWDAAHPLTANYTVTGSSNNALSTAKRFQCNGVIDTERNVMENSKDLLSNMRGIFNYVEGKYELIIEDTGSSTFSINASHIIEDGGINVDYGSKDQKSNRVIVEFYNGQKNFELDTAISLHSASPNYFSDDGEILEVKAEFPFITDRYVADNMAKTILTRSRNQIQVSFLGTPEMYKLNVGDIVNLTYTPLGFSGKIFRIEALQLQRNGLVVVSMIEYFNIYTWQVPAQEPVSDIMDDPSAFAVSPPTGLGYTDTNASYNGRPFLSWNTPTDYPNYQYRVNIKDSSNRNVLNRIVDTEYVDLFFIKVGTNYVASVTSLNQLGTESSASTLTFTVGQAPIVTDDIQDSTGPSDGITSDKLADGSVSTVKMADLSVVEAKIGSAQITQAKIANAAVGAAQIIDASIQTAKIDNGAITNAKINDLSANKINTGNLNVGRITNGSLTIFEKGAAGTVGSTSAAGGSIVTLTGTSHPNSVYILQPSTFFQAFFNSTPFQRNNSNGTLLTSTASLGFNPVNGGLFLFTITIPHDGQLGGINIQCWLDVVTVTEATGAYDTSTNTANSNVVKQVFQNRRIASNPLISSIFSFTLNLTAGKYYFVRTYSGANDVFFVGGVVADAASARCITTPTISITGLFV